MENLTNMTWSKTSNGNCSAKENVISGSTNNSLFEKKGHRLLPPSLIFGKNSSATSFIGPSNSFHDPGLVEERYAGADERSIFQAAVRDLHQPNMEATLPEGLMSVSLLRHQILSLSRKSLWHGCLIKNHLVCAWVEFLLMTRVLVKLCQLLPLYRCRKRWRLNLY